MYLRDYPSFKSLPVETYNKFATEDKPFKLLLDSSLRFIDLSLSGLVISIGLLSELEPVLDYTALSYSEQYQTVYHFENVYYCKEYDLFIYIQQHLDYSSFFEPDEYLINNAFLEVTGVYYDPYTVEAYKNFKLFSNKYFEYYDYESRCIEPLNSIDCISDLSIKAFKYIN